MLSSQLYFMVCYKTSAITLWRNVISYGAKRLLQLTGRQAASYEAILHYSQVRLINKRFKTFLFVVSSNFDI